MVKIESIMKLNTFFAGVVCALMCWACSPKAQTNSNSTLDTIFARKSVRTYTEQAVSPEQVKELSRQYDLFDMEAYAVALFCQMHDIPFYCLKAVSDNLDGNLKDWRSILADIRARFTELLNRMKKDGGKTEF